MKIPVNAPVITDEAKKAVMDALESGWVSSAGQYIEKFEHAFADFLGIEHAVTVTNGTAALHLALATLRVGPGDEVILPTFTMGACLDAVLYTGATPVFVDSEPDTFTMDPVQVQSHITAKTKAIMPVHIYGHSCAMDPILALAKDHNIAVVEDAAEAHGGKDNGRYCGTMGTMGCFSFYANKIITTGEGGMVVTRDAALAERLRSLRDLAHDPVKRFWHNEMAFNYRMTNLQAALGWGQLQHIDDFLAHKQWMAARYTQKLSDIAGLQLPTTRDGVENVFWMYAVLVKDSLGMSRDALRSALAEKGIDTRDFFYPLSDQPFAAPYKTKEAFPIAADIAQRGFYLPSGLALTEAELDAVCDTLHALVR